ncbi:uncharacterized protein LOC117644704 [Thrips palmi]|uniref:Uncharacterized protein LOC117644704 n=1 Tax=Thrips palmi TaxID=161013 RepID=A0A6P8ZM94_THRPL|nr:uncharacterized protein LOC117644704 [Thrips palmi]
MTTLAPRLARHAGHAVCAALLAGLAVLAALAVCNAAAVSPSITVAVSVNGTFFNTTFTEEDLVDAPNKKPAGRAELAGNCTAEACQGYCRQRLHASGRCDADQCICRNLKDKGRDELNSISERERKSITE